MSAEPRDSAAPAAPSDLLVRCGSFFFKYRDFLFPAVFLVLAAASRPRLPFGSRRWDLALDVLGIGIALAGQVVRALVIGLAYIRRGGKDKKVYADTLVQEGVFAHSRNPLYLGNFLALVGFCVIHDSALCYLVGIPFFAFAYLAIVVAEEDFLRRKFGPEFTAYCRRVPRFLPRLSGLGATLGSMEFDWKRLVRKEYGSTFAGATLVLVLLVWDRYRLFGPEAARHAGAIAALVWIPLVAGYLTVRVLKKKGTLGRG